MRYTKPNATKLGRAIAPAVEFGDSVPAFMLGIGSASAGVVGFILMITEHPFFLLLMLPMIITIMLAVSWQRNTIDLGGYSGDDQVTKALALYDSIRGQFTDSLALPLVEKVMQHSSQGAHDYMARCPSGECDKRISALRELVPATRDVKDMSDVQSVLDFIKARKELGE